MLCIRSAELIQVINKSLYPLTNISHLLLLSSPWQLQFYFVSMNLTFFRSQIQVRSYSICLSQSDIFPQHNALKVHPCYEDYRLPSLSQLNNTSLFTQTTASVSVCQWTLMCPCLVIVNNAAVNTVMHTSLQDPIFISTGYIPRHEMTIICSSNYFF